MVMPRYILITADAMDLEERLKELGAEYYRIGASSWAIRSHKSSREISEAVFSRDSDEANSPPTHIIVRLDAYWGYHNRDLWEFLDKKEE